MYVKGVSNKEVMSMNEHDIRVYEEDANHHRVRLVAKFENEDDADFYCIARNHVQNGNELVIYVD